MRFDLVPPLALSGSHPVADHELQAFFSSLDAETLNAAIDALQALQQGDRMISVISHVADLAERPPSRIQVVKSVSDTIIAIEPPN